MADLKVVEIKKDRQQKSKAKSFNKKGYVPQAKKKKKVTPFVTLLQQDMKFLQSCQAAGLPLPSQMGKGTRRGTPTIDHKPLGLIRQYSKWRQKRGIAWLHRNEVV